MCLPVSKITLKYFLIEQILTTKRKDQLKKKKGGEGKREGRKGGKAEGRKRNRGKREYRDHQSTLEQNGDPRMASKASGWWGIGRLHYSKARKPQGTEAFDYQLIPGWLRGLERTFRGSEIHR